VIRASTPDRDALAAAIADMAANADMAAGPVTSGPAAGSPSGLGSGVGDVLDDEAQKAYAYVLRSTQQRPQTQAEIALKLRRRDVDDVAAEAALRKAREVGAIDDRAFARAWVEDRGGTRGYGRARLRQELRRRLVDDALIDEALVALDDRDDIAVATELAAQRARQYGQDVDPVKVARRLLGYLVRRGYPPALAQRAATAVTGLDRSWD